jgi:hypothetical protein
MNRRARLLFSCFLCLMTAGCLGPNPWTVDPQADCRSAGLTPGSTRFNECVLLNKDLQGGRPDLATTPQKTNADGASLAAQRFQTRSCDPTTGICASSLLQQ